MTDYVWERTAAKNLRPRDIIRDPDYQNDTPRRVQAVDLFNGNVYLYLAGQPDAVRFAPDALFERRMSVDEFLVEEDAKHEARLRQEAG